MQRLFKWSRQLLCLVLLVTMASWSLGCNTMEGLGRDVEAGGDALEDAAHDAK